MFETLIPQYLNELVESEIGDFASPEAFHTLKVQRLGRDKVKSSETKVGGKFKMPIFALVGNMPIQADDLPETPLWLQPIPARIFTIDTVIPILKLEKMVMNITQVVKHITKTHVLRVFAYLIFVRSATLFFFTFFFHGFSHITLLTANYSRSVARLHVCAGS